jgi:hypothetical protein
MAEGGDRHPSGNADLQTEPSNQFPPLFEARTRKQLRSNEKRRLTNLSKRVSDHVNNFGSRTKLQFLRKEMTNQLEECIRAHNLFCQSRDLKERPSDDWIIVLENFTAMLYGRIDEYRRAVNRPSSAVASNTGSSVHCSPISVHSNPVVPRSNPGSVHSNPVSAHGNPVVPRSNPGSVHSNPVSVVHTDLDSIFPRNPASGAQHNPAADTHSVRSPLLSTHFDNFRMP